MHSLASGGRAIPWPTGVFRPPGAITMLLLCTFVAVALVATGVFALSTGDGIAYSVALVALLLAIVFVAPQLPHLMAALQHVLDAAVPIAIR
jgi:hypothetical protein